MNSKKINNASIGTDPEMFLYDTIKGKFVPVCGLIGGTKEEPKKITEDGHAIQEDNVAVEFCIPPVKIANEYGRDSFIEHIKFVKNYIQETILDTTYPGLVLKCQASTLFDKSDLQSEQAQTFGCDQDYDAYDFKPNSIDKSKIDPRLRSCGFHIHVGFDNPDPNVCIELVKAFDLFAGLPSLLIDLDTDRRKLYGKAGCYRLKDYGVEMRLLSAALLDNEETLKFVYDSTIRTIDFVNEGGIITNEKEIQHCINTSDRKKALEILEDYNIELPKNIELCVE